MRDSERGVTGVIDTLSLGYATINRRPWLLAVPILLDLFLWLGPRLSPAPVIQRVLERAAIPGGLSDEILQSYAELQQSTVRAAEGFNLLSLLASNFPGLPSVMAGREGMSAVVHVANGSLVVGLVILLGLVGSWLGSLYYTAVGRLVTGGALRPADMLGDTTRNWLRMVGLALAVITLALALGVPLALLAVAMLAVAPGALGFLASLAWVTLIWVEFYLFFAVDAIVISRAGPLQAVRNSFNVVRYNLGSSLGLIALIWIIMLGMPVVWGALLDNPITTAVAILGGAYISTGVATASMLFYRERFAALATGVGEQGSGVR